MPNKAELQSRHLAQYSGLRFRIGLWETLLADTYNSTIVSR
jgi:hypothetical protein